MLNCLRMCLRHPKISKISRGHAPRPPLATLVTTLSAAAYGSKSSTPKLKILSTALVYTIYALLCPLSPILVCKVRYFTNKTVGSQHSLLLESIISRHLKKVVSVKLVKNRHTVIAGNLGEH